MNVLDLNQTVEMLLYTADRVIESEPLLTEVDSKIGDGDHGLGMKGGMIKAKETLEKNQPYQTVNAIFMDMGMAMLNSMGGASGVIFGSMFLGAGKGLEEVKTLTADFFSNMMRNALESIKKRGKASVGDKTMVDALEPAVIAMENNPTDDLCQCLQVAKVAAQDGVEKTKDMIANFGRAKSLMERAIGYQDAGATSIAIIFEAMFDYCSGNYE